MVMNDNAPTKHQRDAIRAIDRHTLVSAGAGSGKTATVVNRLLYMVGVPVHGDANTNPVPLDRIAAITFTLASAAELKDRTRKGLRKAGREDLARRVDAARIGTIHSFCGDVLREFALRRGMAAVLVLEEGETRGLADEAARDALVQAVERGLPGIGELITRRKQDDVHAAVVQLLDQGDRLRHLLSLDTHEEDEAVLLQVAGDALQLIESRLRDRGAVDFDRMLTWTRDLIRDDAYSRRTLQRRIHTLIIDEFQDVDPVQWEIARLLAEPATGSTETPWLLLVGDPKQSIYRFRRADITTWNAARREIEDGGGMLVPLNANFRSTAPILDFVAATAGSILDQPVSAELGRQDYEVDFERLTPGREDQRNGPPVELIAMPPGNWKVDEVRAIEAEAIARRAVELNEGGVAWADMALLFSAWGAAELYQSALRRHGIPTYLLLDQGFYERREVIDQVLALQAVRDPLDDRALMGFLRSPFVGVKDETLFLLAQGGRGAGRRMGDVQCAERDLVLRGKELLERAERLRDRVPADVLLADLLERSGYWAHLALMGAEKAQAIANVRKFLLLLRGQSEATLGEILRGIAAQREREDRIGDARLFGETDDVVTLSTIHSAKGLEWDVVFWCDLVRDPKGQHPKVLIGRDGVALKDPEAEEQSERWTRLTEEIAAEEAAERKRLWYVAATRARRHLILSPFQPDKDKFRGDPPVEALQEVLGMAGTDVLYPREQGGVWKAVVRMANPADVPEVVDDAAQVIPDEALDAIELPREQIVVPAGRSLHSATEAMVFGRCETKHWFQYVMGLREPGMDRRGAEFGGAVARGQIVHDVLEQYRIEAELDGLIDDAVRKWDPDAPPPDSTEGSGYRGELRREIESVATDPAWRDVADLPGARRELKFVHLAGVDRGWQGALDLVARGPDGQILLDVKTGGSPGDDWQRKAAQYDIQRDVYARAAEAVVGEPVVEFRFHFSRTGQQVCHMFAALEREGFADELSRAAIGMECHVPRLTEYQEECRWCGFKRVGWCMGVESMDEPSKQG
jgi:ATP-dependent helicase/nuclease subunit A